MPLNGMTIDKTYIEEKGDRVVTIGNPDVKGEFCSHVSCKMWGEDTISFEEVGIKGTSTEKDGTVTLDSAARKLEWYYTDDELHWVQTLKSKPTTNKWQLKVNAGDFRFLYQTPFEDKAVNGSYTEYYEQDGEDWVRLIRPDGDVVWRPLNIDGSYAVYHKTKRNNQYKVGKAFHIPRPKAIDADGNWVWIDLEIKDGVYTETVPQAFLDTAKYPVKCNATFGFETKGANSSPLGPDRDGAFGPHLGAAGNATHVSFYWDGLSSTPITVGIWADNAGTPGTLIGQSDGTIQNTNGQFTTIALNTSPAITASLYWAGFNCDDDQPTFYYDDDPTPTESRWSNATTYSAGNLSSPWDTVGDSEAIERLYSAFITYTPSGAGLSIPVAMHHYTKNIGSGN